MNDLVYNIDMTNNNTINERENKMIPADLIYNAYMANADSVISVKILGKGLYLLHMVGEDYPQKMNSYAVMKRLSVQSEDWKESESDDGHRELYDDLDIADTVLE